MGSRASRRFPRRINALCLSLLSLLLISLSAGCRGIVDAGPPPPAVSSVALTADVNPAALGAKVTFSATVSPSGAIGTITFNDGSTALGTVPLTSGTATIATATLVTGSHSITAAYSGDATHAAASSAPLVETINLLAATIALTADVNPAHSGEKVTFTARVSDPAATGNITFNDGSTALGSVALSSGMAVLSTAMLSAGSHSIIAVYGSDATHAAATSAALEEVIQQQLSTSITLTSDANPAQSGAKITFTANVSDPAAGGNVTFNDGNTSLGVAPLKLGVATLSTSTLSTGSHSITASYSGDVSHSPSTSTAVVEVINSQSASIALTSDVNPAQSGAKITFTAKVSDPTATGNITFNDGNAPLGTVTLSSGVATLSTSTLSVGSHSMSAAYAGDATHPAGTSSPLIEIIQQVADSHAVNHIVVMLQENRSFDSHFGQLGNYRAVNGYGLASDIDGLPPNASNPNDQGGTVATFHFHTTCIEGLSPDWLESHGDYDFDQPGSNVFTGDGFVHNAQGGAKFENFLDLQGRRAMGFYDATDLPYYYFMASNFATSDRWFAPLSSNSEPNRIYFFAATSHGHVHDPGQFSSDTVKNIFQLLDAAGITWKVYYQETDGSGAPSTRLNRFQPFASQHAANIVPDAQYFTDLQNGTLPQVAYIEERSGLDEHPGGTLPNDIHSGNDVQFGASFAAQHINAFMQSTAWNNGVFFLSYDEGGSLYDHVSPQPAVHPDGIPPSDLEPKDNQFIIPQGDFNRTGFRVPLIVISPFTKKSYVSHTVADYTAMLKFIETRFGLPSLTKRDAAQTDMLEFFDFANPAWLKPPTPPAQPTNMGCNYTNLQ